jgi:hypothetical protein
VTPDGVITTVAGTGESGFSGDGGPATDAALNLPKALAVLPDGSGFLVGDSANDRVRLVTLDFRPTFALAVAEPSLRIRAGRPFVLHLTLSLAARVRLDVDGRRGAVQSVVVSRPAGTSTLIFGRKLRAGRYQVAVSAQSSDGREVAAGASLVVVRP